VPASIASSASIAPRLRAIDLACRRGPRLLFERLQFDLAPGQLAWVRGRNGRGKTSLLRLAAGLASPERGRVERDDMPCLFIGHATALKEDLTASEALAFLLRLQGRPCTAAVVDGALRRLGLAAQRHAFVRTLSQGQRRRVALARLAVEDEASLWVLDEPFDALDADGVECLHALLQEHLQRGGSVLLSSHAPVDLPHVVVIDLDRLAA
jgi:heme exporter protein A